MARTAADLLIGEIQFSAHLSKRSCMARSRASAPPPAARDRYSPVSRRAVTLPSTKTPVAPADFKVRAAC